MSERLELPEIRLGSWQGLQARFDGLDYSLQGQIKSRDSRESLFLLVSKD